MLPSDRLASSVSRVTSAMLGMTFRAVGRSEQPVRWRTAILPIPGTTPVSVALSSDREGCTALASAMLSIPAAKIEPAMIDDFLRELVNMTAGQLKFDLSLTQQALGLPRIVEGDDPFEAKPGLWSHYVLDADSIRLVVSLAPGVH